MNYIQKSGSNNAATFFLCNYEMVIDYLIMTFLPLTI